MQLRRKSFCEYCVYYHEKACKAAGASEEDYSALQLFAQCARRVRRDFSLASAGPGSVARICQLVEGMPLALELAAPWTRVMDCEEIAREIETNLGFLATTLRDAYSLGLGADQ